MGITLELLTGVSLDEQLGAHGSSEFVTDLINSTRPNYFWPMWEDDDTGARANQHGVEGDSSPMVGIGFIVFNADAPMVDEPQARVIRFDAVDDLLRNGADLIELLSGSIYVFFKPDDLDGSQALYYQGDASVATEQFNMWFTSSAVTFFVRTGGATVLEISIPVAPTAGKWNLACFRQNGAGGYTGWLNGTSYPKAALTQTTTTDENAWIGTPAGAVDVQSIGARALSTPNRFFDGDMFNMVIDSTILSDLLLQEIWELAQTNGLDTA